MHYTNLQIPYVLMDSVGGSNTNGDILNMTPMGGNTELKVTGVLTSNLYAGGTIAINGSNYAVAQNLTDTVTVTGSVTISFTLGDDDAIDPYLPDKSHLSGVDNRFAAAYVKPDVIDDNPDVPFIRNMQVVSFTTPFDFDMKAYHTSSDYWVVYLLGGFQFTENSDHDPDVISNTAANPRETATYGRVDVVGAREGGVIFLETYRDSPPTTVAGYGEASTVVHEIGHLFGGTHGEDGIMCSFGNHVAVPQVCNKTTEFGDATLIHIRTIKHP